MEDITVEALQQKIKEQEANTERQFQKVLSEKKEIEAQAQAYDFAITKLSEVAEDPKVLINLYDENPKSAQIILNKFYGGMSIAEFSKHHTGVEKIDVAKIKEETEKEILKKIEKQKQQESMQAVINSFINSNIPADKVEPFQKEFNELIEWREELNEEKLQKYLKLAQKEVWWSVSEAINKTTPSWKSETKSTDDKAERIAMFKKAMYGK